MVGLLLVAAIVAILAAPSIQAAPSRADSFDILYLSDARPVVVRLQITTEGKPLQEAWTRFGDALFAKVDADKNGTLDEKELARLRTLLALLTGQSGRAMADLATAPKSMTRAELGEYLKKNNLGALRLPAVLNDPRTVGGGIRRGGAPTPEELDKALLELLDSNSDGKLSVAEFEAGIAILTKLDVDENELISTEELMRRAQSPYFIQDFDNGMAPPPSPGVELLAINRKGADASLVRRMLVRYGPKPPAATNPMRLNSGFGQPVPQAPEPTVRRLTKKDLKMSDAMFAALDQDGDDELDTEELARYGQNAEPEVEIALRLGSLASGMKPAELIRAGQPPVKAFASPRGSEVAIEVPGVRLDFMPAPFAPTMPTVGEKPRSRFQALYLNRFRNIDRDGNGYLDMNEAANDQLFRDLFSLFDRDGDGKLFEKELIAALDEVEPIAEAANSGMVTVDLAEAGRGLFGLIDADNDGRFSIRELRAMPKLVERFDSNKDGSLAPNEVPRRFEAVLAPGIGGRVSVARVDRFGRPNGQTRPPVGPVWFQKMDRNRDGDVSRREFLGAEDEFRKLDADGDGLIGATEAEAAAKK